MTTKELPTVTLTRKYGSMPTLVQKSVISLQYKDEGVTPQRITSNFDPIKTGNKHNITQGTQGLPLVMRSSEIPAKNVSGSAFRREVGWRSPLLEQRQTVGVVKESAWAIKSPNLEKTVVGSAGKRRLREDVKFPGSWNSEWLARISASNNRVNGRAKTRVQNKDKTESIDKAQTKKGVKARKLPLQRTECIQRKTDTTNKDSLRFSQALSPERELFFQDYRQKCIQWLKSLPDSGMEPIILR